MDSKKGIKNVVTSIVFKILTIILHLFAIRSIDFIGSSYLGYNSLFNSIIDVISLTECGFAGGVAFCLYKAIVDKDENKIIGLYSYLKKAYFIIFILFVCLGLLVLPNISILNADLDSGSTVSPDIYFSYLMYILSAALIYLFGFKATMISAYKNTYKREFAFSVGVIVQYSLQILFAYLTKSFVLCSISLVAGTLCQWLIITFIFRKDHKELLHKKGELSLDEKKIVRTYIFSSFAHHLGDIILYSTDGIIISAFLGTVALAGYYRYTSIISAIFSVSTLLFTSLTSVVGHSFAKENKGKMFSLFKIFYCANFIIGSILFAGFFGASDSFVAFFYGESNVISCFTVSLLSLCYFLRFMQRTCLLFRDASGSFRNDWYKPIIESLLNLILDLVLVKVFGVNGVIIATIITLVFVSHVIEPLVLYKHSFGSKPIKYYLINYSLLLLFVGELLVILFIKNMLFEKINLILGFFVLGFTSVIIAGAFSIPLFIYARMNLKKVKNFNRGNGQRFFLQEIDYYSDEGAKALERSDILYTTRMWTDFILSGFAKKAAPCLLKISLNNKTCFFIGVIFKKKGIKMCGSPFEGWSTPYMGFIWIDSFKDDEIIDVIKGTAKYLLKRKKCLYIQISDTHISCDLLKKHNIRYDIRLTPFLDLTKSEDELFASFKGDVRTNSRNFLKRGAAFEIAKPTEPFIVNYYNQLVDVFDKQGLESFYSKEKLIRFVNAFKDYPSYIFCENAFLPDTKKSIATGIFLGYKERCFFFGNASYREDQHYKPNEYIIWQGILYWKRQGCTLLDMCGVRSYKNKFRPTIVEYPIIYFQKLPFLHFLKKIAMKIVLKSRKKK